MEITRPTIMEIDLESFKHTYINTQIDIIKEFDIVAVAIVDEGVQLRKLGYENEIFILNQPYPNEIEKIINYNLVPGVSSLQFIEALGDTKEKVKIHLEIGTGMGRTGIKPDNVHKYACKIKEYKNIEIEGIYTHLSSPDYDEEYTKKQLNSFDRAVAFLKEEIGEIKYIHASASNAILNFKEAHYNLVRPGMILYGYESADDTLEKIDLRPVAKLKSKIILLKDVKAGTSIGYGRSFIVEKDTKIATIPIGYADGFRRMLSNKWHVFINGKKVPIVGKICMDGFMADVTELDDVKIGDEVIIWDNENIKLEEIAAECQTINYEIMATISARVPRIFS